ncbi:hypothetical protein E2C01_083727 [Portunus trituberculatus]|uniref:Uncharacterized protein n=1 Tax=Portunus trituberculatus TaxID=210409 RepID=A0A5B7J4E0_PORTR|nr:hypothetical protein [Portunus trituberculatus]
MRWKEGHGVEVEGCLDWVAVVIVVVAMGWLFPRLERAGEHLKDVGGSSAIAGVRHGDQWNRASDSRAEERFALSKPRFSKATEMISRGFKTVSPVNNGTGKGNKNTIIEKKKAQ